jgi:putative transposase
MVSAHVAGRSGLWLVAEDLKHEFKRQYGLHSQSIQALAEKLEANVQTATKSRQKGHVDIRYPYRPKPYQTVTWKTQGIRVRDEQVKLSNGRGRAPLGLPLPEKYRMADIRQVELLRRADHYELALTIDTGRSNPRDSLARRAEAERMSGGIGEYRTAPALGQADCA